MEPDKTFRNNWQGYEAKIDLLRNELLWAEKNKYWDHIDKLESAIGEAKRLQKLTLQL